MAQVAVNLVPHEYLSPSKAKQDSFVRTTFVDAIATASLRIVHRACRSFRPDEGD